MGRIQDEVLGTLHPRRKALFSSSVIRIMGREGNRGGGHDVDSPYFCTAILVPARQVALRASMTSICSNTFLFVTLDYSSIIEGFVIKL